MRKKLKTFFGRMGLVAVVAMTIFAYSLPSPEASATNAAGNINVTLQVIEPEITTAKINSPNDGDIILENIFSLIFDYTYAHVYEATVINVKTDQSLDFSGTLEPEENGIVNIPDIDLKNIGGVGDYIVTVRVTNKETGDFAEDSVRFTYKTNIPEVPDTGNFSTSLNITQTDYLISGLVVFLAISFGLLLLVRKDRRN